MTVLTIRNLNAEVKTRLRVQAAQQGIAMEEAARRILTRAVSETSTSPPTHDLAQRIQARFAGLGEFAPPQRHTMRASPFASDQTNG